MNVYDRTRRALAWALAVTDDGVAAPPELVTELRAVLEAHDRCHDTAAVLENCKALARLCEERDLALVILRCELATAPASAWRDLGSEVGHLLLNLLSHVEVSHGDAAKYLRTLGEQLVLVGELLAVRASAESEGP